MNKPYFAKYIIVDGEVKRRTGSTVNDGEAGKCLRENDEGYDYYQKTELFLCSRDSPGYQQEILTKGIKENQEFSEKEKSFLTLGSLVEI